MSVMVPVPVGVGAIGATLNPTVACASILVMGLIVIKAMDNNYKVCVKHGDTTVEFEPVARKKEQA